MPKITFLDQNTEFDASDGDSILDIALANDIDIPTDCGGNAVCGTCHVHIEQGAENLSELTDDEEELLEDVNDRQPNSRLACQADIYGDIKITIPPV